MDAFVLDASTAIAWAYPSQTTDEAVAWLDHVSSGTELVAPAIWPVEVANALLVLQRRRKLTPAERADALTMLGALPVGLDHQNIAHTFSSVSALAAEESLSVYDAMYLELAIRLAAPLACGDGPLRSAARRRGVAVAP